MWAALKPRPVAHLARHCIIMSPFPATFPSTKLHHHLPPHHSAIHFPSPASSSFLPPQLPLHARYFRGSMLHLYTSPLLTAFMACVSARDLSLHFADLRPRPSELPKSMFINPDRVANDTLTCLQSRSSTTHHQQFPQQGEWIAVQHASTNDVAQTKKRKDISKPQAEKWPRIQSMQMDSLFNKAQSPAAHADLSLGQASACNLRFLLENAASAVTTSKPRPGLPMTLRNFLSAHIRNQQDEVFDLLKLQIEQLRRNMEERMQLHSKTLIALIEERISHVLHVRDVEIQEMNQKNIELQQKVDHLCFETQAWQSKAWTYDAMVTALRANLQQVLTQKAEFQGKLEGFGDSDNAASSLYLDEAAHKANTSPGTANKTPLQRVCKECKSNEASILLLPCLHLCLCQECRNNIERCPSCYIQICDRVQVYLS